MGDYKHEVDKYDKERLNDMVSEVIEGHYFYPERPSEIIMSRSTFEKLIVAAERAGLGTFEDYKE